MGRQDRFKSKIKEGRDSHDSTNAYSEDKIRYFFQDEQKPRQSEFLKTLIEKSHRKKTCALRNIYASIQARQKRDSIKRKKQAPVASQRKFIQLRESSDRKTSVDGDRRSRTQNQRGSKMQNKTGKAEVRVKKGDCKGNLAGKTVLAGKLGESGKAKRDSRYKNHVPHTEQRKRKSRKTEFSNFNNSQPHHRVNMSRKLKEPPKKSSQSGVQFADNKNHYLLTSFSRNKSKPKGGKPKGQRTETGERIPSSKRGVGNYTSLNYCSVQQDFDLQVGTPVQRRLYRLGLSRNDY